MTHLQAIQTTNHVSPNIHENPKLQTNKHKIMISLRYIISTENSRPIMHKANKHQEPNP